MNTQRNYANEVLADTIAGVVPNQSVAERACAQADELREVNADLVAALQGIFAQTAKHSRQWGQAESARQFASDPDTAKVFIEARAALARAGGGA